MATAAAPSGTGEQPPIEPAEAVPVAPDPGTAGPAEEERRRRRRRGGRHRRREEGEAQPEAAARIAAAPRFQGATPANPFGDAAFDLFDAVEAGPAEAATVTAAAPAPSEIPAAAAPQPEPIATAAPAAPDTTEPVAAPPADPAAPPAVPAGPIASIEIKPIVVDEVIAEAPKKRGWWRR